MTKTLILGTLMLASEVAETQFHHWMEIVVTALLPVIAGGILKLIWAASKAAAVQQTILTNHLPHLDEKIDGVKNDVTEIRQAFVAHLQNVKD